MKSRFLVTIVYFNEKPQKRVFSFHKGESCRAVVVQHRQLILNQDEKGCGYLFQIDSCREHDERKKWFQTNHQGLTTLNGFLKVFGRADKPAGKQICYHSIIKSCKH